MTNKSMIFSLIIMVGLVSNTNAIMFKLMSKDPTCLKFSGNNTYVISYVSSGENDNNVKMEAFDNDQFVMRKQNSNDFTHTLKFQQGIASVCFSRTDNKQKTISFDFYPETDPIKDIIEKKDLHIALSSLHKAVSTLKEVGRNQKFHIERNQINRTILEQSESRIKWAGIIKIVFLITSALIQLYIMKSFFSKNSVPYQPVDQH